MADRAQGFDAAWLPRLASLDTSPVLARACSPPLPRSSFWGGRAELLLPALPILPLTLARSLCLLLAMSAMAEPASTICPRCSALPAIRAPKPAPRPPAPPRAFLQSARHRMHRHRHGCHCRQAKLHGHSSPRSLTRSQSEPSSPLASPCHAARGATPLRSASPLRRPITMQLYRRAVSSRGQVVSD
jgi:hypothetical protein